MNDCRFWESGSQRRSRFTVIIRVTQRDTYFTLRCTVSRILLTRGVSPRLVQRVRNEEKTEPNFVNEVSLVTTGLYSCLQRGPGRWWNPVLGTEIRFSQSRGGTSTLYRVKINRWSHNWVVQGSSGQGRNWKWCIWVCPRVLGSGGNLPLPVCRFNLLYDFFQVRTRYSDTWETPFFLPLIQSNLTFNVWPFGSRLTSKVGMSPNGVNVYPFKV